MHFLEYLFWWIILDKLSFYPVSSVVIFQPLPPSFHQKGTQTFFMIFTCENRKMFGLEGNQTIQQLSEVQLCLLFPHFPLARVLLHYQIRKMKRPSCWVVTTPDLPCLEPATGIHAGGRHCPEPSEQEGPLCQCALAMQSPLQTPRHTGQGHLRADKDVSSLFKEASHDTDTLFRGICASDASSEI